MKWGGQSAGWGGMHPLDCDVLVFLKAKPFKNSKDLYRKGEVTRIEHGMTQRHIFKGRRALFLC